jgi:ABC-2 type transport system ATP-binding protein
VNVLEIEKLCKVFRGKRGRTVEALKNLDLTVASGEVFGFLGPNGAGKSTTIKTIMGQVRATSGTVSVLGQQVTDAQARCRIGYLPENPAFYDFLTAREYLGVVGRFFAMAEAAIERESERVLRLLELHDAADRTIRGYSKGMVQRLGLAQALLHDPDLYILDEPMSGLDPIGRALVKEVIKELKTRGKTVFFSTHITADVEIICDRVGVIVKGRLMAVDSVKNILRSGVEGYDIQVTDRAGRQYEVSVEKERLKDALAEMAASEASIERIEPKRKDLEAFFLDIVAKGARETE